MSSRVGSRHPEDAPEGGDGRQLSLVHWGSFSGTVRGMRETLGGHALVSYHDLASLTHHPGLLLARARAQTACLGHPGPWYKTAVWPKAIERRALNAGWISESRPTLFLQTLAALRLQPLYRYAIYTDRVAQEGAREAEPYRSSWGPGWIEREKEFLSGASAIFVMGPATRQALTDLYDIATDKVRVVGAGPGTRIGPVSLERGAPRRLLFVGTNWTLKGGPEVVEAFSRVSRRRPHLELVLAGSEPIGPIPPRARALGRVPGDTMSALFTESDLLVVPTHMEALGYSLLEALMHGLPAIGSTVGNQSWLIGDAGITVEAGNVTQIEHAIETVLADFTGFKERAVRRAVQLRKTMTWERVATSIVDGFLVPEP